MADYIDTEGLQIPTVQELREALGADQRSNVDPLIATDSDSLAGNVNGIVASHLREAWEALRVGFDAVNPDNAEDAQLDAVCAITGTFRNPALYSTFAGTKKLTVTLDPGGIAEVGVTVFHALGDPTLRFVCTETVENTTGVQADFLVAARAETIGPVVCNAGTLTVIATPAAGLIAVTNTTDATIGSERELDGALRIRRENELRQGGATTAAALKADLLAYEDEDGNHPVLAVEILENTRDTENTFGIPAHSCEAIVWDGIAAATDDDALLAICEANRPNGHRMFGQVGAGNAKFTRPTQLAMLLTVVLKKNPDSYIGDAAVKTLLAQTALTEQKPSIGGVQGLVAFSDYLASAWNAGGVTRVTSVQITVNGTVATNSDILLPARSIATLDTSNITITSTDDV